MIITVPIVLFGIFRYQLLSDPNQIISKSGKVELTAQNPEEILLQDKGIRYKYLYDGLWLITIFILVILKT